MANDLYIPNGQTPLDKNPSGGLQWSSSYQPNFVRAGSQQAAESAAFDDFASQFGRNPTQAELSQLAAAYSSGDPNKLNNAGGKAGIANYYQQVSNTPDQIAAKQNQKYLEQAPQHYADVTSQFQSVYGRAPTQDELDHFGAQLAAGNTDKYQLQQFLQQQPEYQNTQNKNFQDQLSNQLQGYDKQYFGNSILPSIQEAYAKQGRSFDSSSFQAAATNSAQQQNVSRENFLANLSASQYSNQQANAYNAYSNQVANTQALTNSGINAQYAGIQNSIQRSNELNDYQTQQNAYNNYLATYGKRNNGLGGLIGGGVGAGIGAYFGGPAGAKAGYQLGSGFGNYAQGGSY